MPTSLVVIDGNSLMHRAFHAIPDTLNAPDGTPTNAVHGFFSMVYNILGALNADAVVCAFDAGKPQFRIEHMAQYKAQRPPMDPNLRVQFPIVEELLGALHIPVVKVPGWEGDDILGTVAARADAAQIRCYLVTGDKDACQLASEYTSIVNTKRGTSEVVVLDPAGVYDKYGVTPDQFPDFLGLMGDTSDNIPGVPGIGPKSATKLLQQFSSIEGIYEHLDALKGKQLQNLTEHKDDAFLSREIATIVRDLDFELDVAQLSFPAFSADDPVDVFTRYGLISHLDTALSFIGGARETLVIEASGVLMGDEAVGQVREYLAHYREEHGDLSLAEASADAPSIGLALRFEPESSAESMFPEPALLAVSTPDFQAVISGDEAFRLAVEISRSVHASVIDAKAFLSTLSPSNHLLAAHISDSDLFAVRLFDSSLAEYILSSQTKDVDEAWLAREVLHAELAETTDTAEALIEEATCARLLWPVMYERLVKDESTRVFFEIDTPLIPVLVDMERTGARLDYDALAQLGQIANEELEGLIARIYELADEKFNIDSPKQVGHILFEKLGLPAKKKTSRGYSTDAKVLNELAAVHELPGLILKYREFAKLKNTYIDALPKQAIGGLLHTSFNQKVTATGRLSSSDPNLQNIPVRSEFGKKIRECFVPLNAGDVFVSADYSQIELRLLAHLSEDEHLIAAFNSGADFHAATAARVFGVPVEEVTPQLRSRAKAVNFGIVYGQQAFGLSQSLHISFGEAQEMIDRYFEAYPYVRTYLDNVVADARAQGFATTMFGRKRHIPELLARNAQQRSFGERTAMNHPMQGSAADIIKLAMIDTERALREAGLKARIMLQVHDELDLSVPADETDEVAVLLKRCMENVVELSVPLVADVCVAKNWAEAH